MSILVILSWAYTLLSKENSSTIAVGNNIIAGIIFFSLETSRQEIPVWNYFVSSVQDIYMKCSFGLNLSDIIFNNYYCNNNNNGNASISLVHQFVVITDRCCGV